MRYRIDLCYCGADFHGWQIQPDAPSVQGELEKALGILLRERISVVGAGRTDTAVNASAYTAHFDAGEVGDTEQLRYRLNAILPGSIAVRRISRVDDGFHARFGAKKREYRYYIHREKDPFADRFSYWYGYPDIDFDAMNRAAALLPGRRDFSCFEKTGADNKTGICTVYSAGWTRTDENHWVFTISADRFLRNMVRAIVGTLLEVGRGKRSVESVKELIDSGTRCDAGESVPGHALFLTGVEY